jgi:hypothetical protein
MTIIQLVQFLRPAFHHPHDCGDGAYYSNTNTLRSLHLEASIDDLACRRRLIREKVVRQLLMLFVVCCAVGVIARSVVGVWRGVPQNATKRHKTSQNVTKCHKRPQNFCGQGVPGKVQIFL